jgi:glycosyltransferase involved in cell wall biosynthesis
MNPNRHIVIICSNRWHSAITEYALCTHRALKERAIKVTTIIKKDSTAQHAADAAGVDFIAVDNFTVDLWRVVRNLSKKHQLTFITFGGQESLTLRMLGHQFIRVCGDEPRGLLRGFGHGKSKLAIYPSRVSRLSWLRSENQKSAVIAIGRDEQSFSYKNGSITPDIVIFGRLDPIKGHKKAIEIFAHGIEKKYFGDLAPRLKIIGLAKNTSWQELQNFGWSKGLTKTNLLIESRVIPDPATEMSTAAIGWVPSLGSEWICRVGQEFAMCGVPLAVSGAGSLKEVLFDQDAGVSLEGLSLDRSAALLGVAFQKAFIETNRQRQDRSLAAQSFFSLNAMGEAMAAVLD